VKSIARFKPHEHELPDLSFALVDGTGDRQTIANSINPKNAGRTYRMFVRPAQTPFIFNGFCGLDFSCAICHLELT
jgi:hypothetical protein